MEKAVVNSGLNSPDRNSQGPGVFYTGIFANTSIQTGAEKVLEGERKKEEEEKGASGADSTFAEAESAIKIQREQEKENGCPQEQERGRKDKWNALPPAGLAVMTGFHD